jgi:hypothetical protein
MLSVIILFITILSAIINNCHCERSEAISFIYSSLNLLNPLSKL